MTLVPGRMRLALGPSRALRLALATSLIASVVVVAVELPVRAAAQTFTATADAQVREANPSTTYGTTTALRVDAGSDPDVESYLRFAVSGLSGSVQTATLRVWVTTGTGNGPAVYTTADTWSETAITWANRTLRTGSGVDDKASVPAGAYLDFNVTSLVPGDGSYNFVLAGTSSDGVDFSSREAATNKPQLVVTTTGSGDLINPSDPTNLGASAVSSGRIDLSWTASTDNVGVTGYEIFRNGTLLPPVGAVTTFADTTVAPSTSYAYQVRAFDAAGNRSGLSASATATTPAAPSTTTSTFAPTADAYVAEATSSTNFGTSTTLRVDAGTDPDVESYIRFPVTGLTGAIQSAKLRLWVGTDTTANGPAVYTTASTWSEGSITWANRTARVGTGTDDKGSIPTNSWVEYNVASLVGGNGTYDFVLAGTSTDGINFSSREASTNKPQLVIVTQASGDTENPTDPSSLSATPTSGTRIDLSWTGSTDNTAVTNYEIFRNGSLLTTVGDVTSYADTSAVNATTYDYKVRAVDGAGNRSGFSNTASATTPDTQNPTPPTQVNATASSSDPGRSDLDGRDRQRRRHELRDLPGQQPAHDRWSGDQLHRFDREPVDDVCVSTEGRGRGRQPLRVQQLVVGNHACADRRRESDGPDRSDGNRREPRADRPHVDGLGRQRRRCELRDLPWGLAARDDGRCDELLRPHRPSRHDV